MSRHVTSRTKQTDRLNIPIGIYRHLINIVNSLTFPFLQIFLGDQPWDYAPNISTLAVTLSWINKIPQIYQFYTHTFSNFHHLRTSCSDFNLITETLLTLLSPLLRAIITPTITFRVNNGFLLKKY